MTSATNSWSWHHTGLAVENLSAALDFYKTNFAFEPIFEALDMTDLIQQVTGVAGLRADLVQCQSAISNQVLELIKFRFVPENASELLPIRPGRAHTCFLVPDLDQAVSAVLESGGGLFGEITEFSEGRAAYCFDGAGNALELEEASPGQR